MEFNVTLDQGCYRGCGGDAQWAADGRLKPSVVAPAVMRRRSAVVWAGRASGVSCTGARRWGCDGL